MAGFSRDARATRNKPMGFARGSTHPTAAAAPAGRRAQDRDAWRGEGRLRCRPSARRARYLHRTRPHRSRQHRRQCERPQRSRQHRRHEASVTSLTVAVTPGASGAIGAALTFSEIATRSKPETATAKMVRMSALPRFFTGQTNTSEKLREKKTKTDHPRRAPALSATASSRE
jgi:hypothetical protein